MPGHLDDARQDDEDEGGETGHPALRPADEDERGRDEPQKTAARLAPCVRGQGRRADAHRKRENQELNYQARVAERRSAAIRRQEESDRSAARGGYEDLKERPQGDESRRHQGCAQEE